MKTERYLNEKLAWSTLDEIEYLKNIGKSEQVVKATKRQMLEGYIKGIDKRVNFGKIDKWIVKTYAYEMLDSL